MPGHICQAKTQLLLLELEEEEGIEQEVVMVREDFGGVEHCEISLQALNGTRGYHTLRITGYCHKKALNILIDIESTQNFVDCEVVAKMGWKVDTLDPLLSVNVADGNAMLVY